jgi:hypothetical protein
MKVKNPGLKRFLICLLVALGCSVALFNVYSQTVKPGDVNDSGIVDIVDALQVARYAAGLSLSVFNTSAADVNCDGTINILDALAIARYCAGVITTLGCSVTTAPTATPTSTPTMALTATPTLVRTPTPMPTGTSGVYTPPPAIIK